MVQSKYSVSLSRNFVSVAVVAAFLLSSFSALPAAGAAEDPYYVLGLGTVLEPDDFNPFSMTTGISYMVLWLTYEFLYTAGKDIGPTPQLATSSSVSEDGLVWTYDIAQDSYFHDGIQVTANDVNFTFNMILRNAKDCALLGGYLKNVTKVVALDDFTVQVTTDAPKSTMLSINIPILPEHLWSAVEEDGQIKKVDMWDATYFPDGPIGSGPLILNEYSKAGDFIRLLKWADYHDGVVNMDEVLIKIYNTQDSMVTALETGLIDVAMGVPPTHWDAALEDPNIEGQEVSQLDLVELGLNCASAEVRFAEDESGTPDFPQASTNLETTNLSVRKAVAMAINKTQILEEILRDHADIGDSIVPLATPYWHYFVPEDEEYEFDLEGAKAVLDAAGYIDTDDDGIRENQTSGALLDFKFYYISQTTADQLAAGKIANWLAEIGINAPAIGVTEGSLYTMWFGMEYDMFIWNWQPDPDPSFILSVLTTDEVPEDSKDITAWSDSFYSNPYYDQLYIDQLHETDLEGRRAIIHEMQRVAYLDCPYVVLYYPHDMIAYRTDTFTSYPDMETYPGTAPDWIWFYFEVMPVGADINTAPYDVDAGLDRTIAVNQTLSFTGLAEDADDPVDTLEWEWAFEYMGAEEVLTGQTVEYLFEDIGQVNVTLTVTDPGGLSSSDDLVVTVIPPIEDSGWVVGYVEDGDGDAVVGAVVEAGGTVQQSNLTGYYSLNLAAGTYTVNVSRTGFSAESEEVTVAADETVWLNFTLSATAGDVVGHVYDQVTGDPIEDSTVTMVVGDDTKTFKTNETGYFEFNDVPAGTYNLSAIMTGYLTGSKTVTVVAGETTTTSISLEPEAEDDAGGLSTAAIAAIALAAAVVAGAAAMVMLRRRKGKASQDEQKPPEGPQGEG